MRYLWNILAVGGAGFVGAVLRYVLGLWLNTATMPWGTLLINVSGAFVLGWFATATRGWWSLSPIMVLAVGTGFVGAFTTFSTLMFETNSKLEDGSNWLGFGYLVGSVVLGMAAVKGRGHAGTMSAGLE